MRRLIWAGRALSLLALSCLLQACGGDDDPPGGGAGLLSQAPHCPTGKDALRMEGSLDGAVVNDQRAFNINAGLVNIGQPTFDTPLSNLAPLGPSEIELHLTWMQSLFYGQTDTIRPSTTLFKPGHKPPQVTMPQRTARGSKNILLRGPASSKAGNSASDLPRASSCEIVSLTSTLSASPTKCRA